MDSFLILVTLLSAKKKMKFNTKYFLWDQNFFTLVVLTLLVKNSLWGHSFITQGSKQVKYNNAKIVPSYENRLIIQSLYSTIDRVSAFEPNN